MPLPKQSELVSMIQSTVLPNQERRPNDIFPKGQKDPDIDKDKLSEYLLKITKNDINDRESFSFNGKREYDLKAYYGIKDQFMSNWPHPRASAYPVPITPVHLDVIYTQGQNTMFRNLLKTVGVTGFGKEDVPYAPLVAQIHNWQNAVESKTFEVQSSNLFNTLLHGTGFVKTWVGFFKDYIVRQAAVPLELILKPIRQDGCQKENTDHITQLIPLTENEWKFRIGLEFNGKKVYENLDLITPGFETLTAVSNEEMNLLKSQISGLDVGGNESRDLRYLAETHLEYYPPNSFKSIELIVWWSLKTGIIHRVIKNEDEIRPLTSYKFYPLSGMAFHLSLPQKIKNVQEKANYTDKQITDASDVVINPDIFVEEGSGFDPNNHVKVLGGMYEIRRGSKVTILERNISPIIQRRSELANLWREAEQLDGATELFQGVETRRGNTLGADRMRFAQSQGRFRSLLNTYGIGWSESNEIQYFLNDKYMPRNKARKILGSADYTSLNQIFPKESADGFGLNLEARLNFSIAGKTQDEIEFENEVHLNFVNDIIKLFGEKDSATLWKAMRKKAEIIDFKEYERIVLKPSEAEIMSVDEMLQRIESGETTIVPSPLVNAEEYTIKLKIFQRFNEMYQGYNSEQKETLRKLIESLEVIAIGNKIAELNNQAKNDPEMAQALDDVSEMVANSVQGQGVPNGAA